MPCLGIETNPNESHRFVWYMAVGDIDVHGNQNLVDQGFFEP